MIKTVLLCGGQGTRIGEVTQGTIPKPLVQIGGRPILWHLMDCYARQGFSDFVICAGHLGEKIKDFFYNYRMQNSDLRVQTGSGAVEFLNPPTNDWTVLIADTGAETMTAGRLARVAHHLDDEGPFFLTYGDGLSDVDLKALLAFHNSHGRLATLTGVAPPGRFGEFRIEDNRITQMMEKPEQTERFINGGFMVLEREFIDRYCNQPDVERIMLEREPLERAALDGELMIQRHRGFWQCMDTMRDWELLNRLALEDVAPWS